MKAALTFWLKGLTQSNTASLRRRPCPLHLPVAPLHEGNLLPTSCQGVLLLAAQQGCNTLERACRQSITPLRQSQIQQECCETNSETAAA